MKTNSRMIMLLMTMVSGNFAHGQSNLLPNGNFNPPLGISGWTASGTGTVSFSTLDANIEGGGSMALSAPDSNNAETATSSCFAVTPGVQYIFGGKYEPFSLPGSASAASFQCHSYTDRYCKSGETDLGSPISGPIESDNGFLYWNAVQGTIGNSQSANCTVTGTGYEGLDGDSPPFVLVDDLFFYSTRNANAAPLLGGSLSGSWYDPTQSGQGFQLEFTAQVNTLLATWYTYSPDGSGTTQWVYGQGTYDPALSTVTIPAILTSGTSFPPNFVASNVKKTPWGNLTFTFNDCDHMTMNWSSSLPGYGSGTQQLRRLTSIAGLSCPQ